MAKSTGKAGQKACQAMVTYAEEEGWGPPHRCTNRGAVERNGEHFCGIHDPVALEGRRQARQDKRDARARQATEVRRGEINKQSRQTVHDFLGRLDQDSWFAETLSALVGLANSAERATQAVALLKEQANQWDRIKGGK